jgi:hypothetical protein
VDVHCCEFSSDDPHCKEWRDMFPPQAVDQAIRHAISMCWMMLPKDKKNPDAVATEIHRIVDRALTNLREDAQAFGITDDAE